MVKNILVIRLSALGDVAISVHIIRTAIEQNPNIQIVILTRKLFQALFAGIPRIKFIEPDLYKKHKGLNGLYRLFKEINTKYKIDKVLDIHDVLRTKILRFFYTLKFTKTYKINKGRKEKKNLVRQKNKVLKQLKHSANRYADVFTNAGIKIILSNIPEKQNFGTSQKIAKILPQNEQKKIGIAPFAFFNEKMYPIEKMQIVIEKLIEKNCIIYLFGGGEKEKQIANKITKKYKNVISIIGKFSFIEELSLINRLDFMLTMDSANMHLASLTNTKIVSIWGATHPFAGFSAFNSKQNTEISISNEKLNCRPCSVFGNKKCSRNNLACMNMIKPEEIVRVLYFKL